MTRLFYRLFLDHPGSIGESYSEHARIALRFGAAMVAGGLACLVHAAVPRLFQRSASRTVRRLHDELTAREKAFNRRRTAENAAHWQLEYEI